MTPAVHFTVLGAGPAPATARPALLLRLGVTAGGGGRVEGVLARVQVRLAARERRYTPAEEERLQDVFGEPSRWGETAGDLLWSQEALVVPAFEADTAVDLPLACSYDVAVASGKFLAALETGEIPLRLLFSGMVFGWQPGQGMAIRPIAWEEEVTARVPVSAFRETLDRFFPGQAWIRMDRAVFDRLNRWRSRSGFATWEEALAALLAGQEGRNAHVGLAGE
ncbi:conserved protein of unknown function [Candidatus Hydrogenisulfobacillus filiaventi]|uniref:Uncharacterized protein n=1 Tax=Candidatus Hydrogenisulfobacillus filiaventi TaxID=2707344 RepID=A0A6F8ZJK1_9FIRM|nr:conserved protein of unknown function [Candidatus Hydrogenisulfobacillus filiaventi]